MTCKYSYKADYYSEVDLKFGISFDVFPFSFYQKIIEVKVYACKDHKHTYDDFHIEAVEMCYAVVIAGKTAGSDSSERMYHGIEPR